jgi:hypothetical protein
MALAITFGETCLAFTMGNLPQWRRELFDCREKTNSAFVLARGNGAQHALVTLGKGRGLNLEDLATSGETQRASVTTRTLILIFAILWVALLITVDGLKEYTWFIVAVGGIESLYTSLVAGSQQKPQQVGIKKNRGKWAGRMQVSECPWS